MYNCKLCSKSFEKHTSMAAHTAMCPKNPNRENTIKKAATNRKGKPLSQEHKNKISASRKKYLIEHPDKVPYLLNHSSKKSYPEKIFEDTLNKLGIIGWVYNYQNSIYQYDFAFPNLKIDVEIDGKTHLLEHVKLIDKERDEFSISNGWRVIRFDAKSVTYNPIECVNRVKYIIENEIEDSFTKINLPLPKSIKQIKIEENNKLKQQKFLENQDKIQQQINIVLESNIDFTKFGWVQKISDLLNFKPQKVNGWMKKYMLDFYNDKCFKKQNNFVRPVGTAPTYLSLKG